MAGVSLKISDGAGGWVFAKNVSVSDGAGNWPQARSVKRSDGAGNWTIIWVPSAEVTVTGTTQAMSQESGVTGGLPPYIRPSSFTVTLGDYEPVAVVVLQSSNDAGVTWNTLMTWNAPTENALVYTQTFPSAGNWLMRAAVTLYDSRLFYSNSHAVTVFTKNLASTASDPAPNVFERFTLSMTPSPSATPVPITSKWMSRISGGAWGSDWDTGQSTMTVWQELAATYEWVYEETFSDSSVIYSNSVFVTSAAISHFHEVVPSGGYTEIQTAMDRASRWFELNMTVPVNYSNEQSMSCVQLVAGQTYDIEADELHYRRGVRLDGQGATIKGHGTHIFKGDDNGGGSYNSPHRDWLMFNVIFNCENNCGGLSSAHVFRYRLDTVEIQNIGGGKHHIEINSSGGPVSATDYNVEILNCSFSQDAKSEGVRTEDEAIQLDYSWDGAAPNVANDGTVTNNVLIRGCSFSQVPRAIGGHVYNSKPTKAAGIHSHILIDGCNLTNVNPEVWGDGNPNSANSEGAVRVYYWKDVIIQNNTFRTCFQPVMVYAPDDADGAAYNMGMTKIIGNTFENCGSAGRHCAFGNSGGAKKIGQVWFESNTLRGTWGGGSASGSDGYFAGFDDTTGTLPNSAHNVVIRYNKFIPDNYDLDGQAIYNKYRDGNDSNGGANMVYIQDNTISGGGEDNS